MGKWSREGREGWAGGDLAINLCFACFVCEVAGCRPC